MKCPHCLRFYTRQSRHQWYSIIEWSSWQPELVGTGNWETLKWTELDSMTANVNADPLEYRLDGVISDVVFTFQRHFSSSYLPLICFSTNQNIQLIHSLLIRIEWTTGNGILMSSSHWPIYNKFPPGNHSESSHYNTINDDHYVITYEICTSIYAIGRGGPDSLQN